VFCATAFRASRILARLDQCEYSPRVQQHMSTGADACHSIEKSLRCPESWCETLERRERRRMGVTCMHAFTFLPAVDLFVVTSRPIFINQARVVLDTEHVSRT
jgi:hypothetical protein